MDWRRVASALGGVRVQRFGGDMIRGTAGPRRRWLRRVRPQRCLKRVVLVGRVRGSARDGRGAVFQSGQRMQRVEGGK